MGGSQIPDKRGALALEQLAAIGENCPGIVYRRVLNPDGRIEYPYVSAAIREIYGLEPVQIIANPSLLLDRLHHEDRDQFAETFQISAKDLTPWRLDFRIIDTAGAVHWIHGNSTPHRRENGEVVWDGLLLDISDNRATAESRHRRDSRFRELIEKSNQGILVHRYDEIVFANQTLCNMLGYDRTEDILAFGSVDVWLPDDERQRIRGYAEARLRGENPPAHYEFRALRKDGSEIWLESHAVVLDWRGERAILAAFNDIDTRKRVEGELQSSEQRFRSLVEGSIQGIFVHRDLKILFANEECARILGYESLEALQSAGPLDQHFHTDEIDRLKGYAEARLRGDPVPSNYELRALQKDGSNIWLENRVTLVEWEGEPAIQSVFYDITERKRAEAGLSASEQRFRALVEYAPEAITMLDVDTGLYLDANPMAEALHGLPRDELIGKLGPADLSPETQPDGRPSSEAARLYLSRALAGEFPKFEWMHVDPNGHETLCEVSLARLPDPHRKLVRASISDITERKAAEKELRKSEERFCGLLETSDLGIGIRQGLKLVYANQAFAEMFGYEDSEDILTLDSIERVWSAEDHDRIAKITAARARGEPVPNYYEVRARRKDGSTVWCEIWIQKITWNDSEAYLGAMIDITNRKATEDQLRQAQKMEAVGQLTGGVAHDFNNLLAIIMGNVEMLGEIFENDADARHKIKIVIGAMERAASLTDRLLAFSRQQALSPAATNVTKLIGGMEDMLRRTLGETIDLGVVGEKDLWAATIDAHQFENALVNLAINARDAMGDSGMLTIETANVTLDETYGDQYDEVAPGDYIKVSVSDTGSGMTPDVLEKVFEPFYTTKDIGKGSGLGLSMVYGFVKQSEGHITINSDVNCGTAVHLYLPRSLTAEAMEGPKGHWREFASGSGCILVVEDDESMREVPLKILRDHGYEIVGAADGDEAIEHLATGQSYDLLFTDVVLPGGMNGVELAEKAKLIQPNIKVLFTTGYAENAVLSHGEAVPEVNMVRKPYRRAELLEKIRATLDDVKS